MRKAILILSALAIGQVFGQTYSPFPTDSAYWSVEGRDWWSNPSWGDCISTSHYNMLGDTIIESVSYSKIYSSTKNDGIFNLQNATYYCALREDSLKRIYARRPTDTIELLFYDFSLNIGDTVCMDFLNKGCYTVNNVDTILFAGKQRRRIHIQISETQQWIEGIGNFYGLFQTYYTGSFSTELKCFHENDLLLYGNSQFCHCDNLPGVNEFEANTLNIQFNPNPISESGTLYIKSSENAEYDVKIYDVLGSEIYSNKITKGELNIGSGLSSGLYYIKVWDDHNQIGTRQIIKK